MDEQVFYPAVFFADIVKYYGGSEIHIEELMRTNIAKVKAGKMSELKNLIEELSIESNRESLESNRFGMQILEDLQKIKEAGKEQKTIKKIEQVIGKVKGMSRIDKNVSDQVLLRIQLLSELEGSTGYSDTNIIRFMDEHLNALREEKYNDIIDYLIKPEEKDDFSDLSKWLQECICESKYNGLPTEKREQIRRYLIRDDFSGKHILRIFRTLEKCSKTFSRADNGDKQEKLNIGNELEILDSIINALQNIWGDIEVESIGITQEEKGKISFDVGKDLLRDYKFYNNYTNCDIESSKGFQALIFYRLYNKIFYYMEKNSDNDEKTDDMQKALAFFAFSILQSAIEHTKILLHPAARLESPVYIGNGVMVGKQCTIKSECVLGENVCLYPFNIYNSELLGKNMYIYVDEKTVFCRGTKVLGSIHIGKECVINKSILVRNRIDDRMYVDEKNIVEIDGKKHNEMRINVMEGNS